MMCASRGTSLPTSCVASEPPSVSESSTVRGVALVCQIVYPRNAVRSRTRIDRLRLLCLVGV